MRLREDAPTRMVNAVGPGDFVKLVSGEWHEIAFNTAYEQDPVERKWTIGLDDGSAIGMFSVALYAKAEDLEP